MENCVQVRNGKRRFRNNWLRCAAWDGSTAADTGFLKEVLSTGCSLTDLVFSSQFGEVVEKNVFFQICLCALRLELQEKDALLGRNEW